MATPPASETGWRFEPIGWMMIGSLSQQCNWMCLSELKDLLHFQDLVRRMSFRSEDCI